MPFKSEAQRKYLWANEPEIARDWADTYGSRIQKENGGIMRLGFQNGNEVDDENPFLKLFKGAKEKAREAKDYLSNMAWNMPFSPMGILSMMAKKADRFPSLKGIDQEFITNRMETEGTDPVSGLYRDQWGTPDFDSFQDRRHSDAHAVLPAPSWRRPWLRRRWLQALENTR